MGVLPTGLMPITINTSVLLSAVLSKLLSQHPQGWKICYLIGLLPSVVLLICVFMAPESPRYLLKMKGRGSAERALRKLRNTPGRCIRKAATRCCCCHSLEDDRPTAVV